MANGSISYDIENEKLITGSFTANAQTLDISGPNSGAEVIQVTGTWIGTIVVEGSQDSSNFVSLPFIVQSSGLIGSSITANGTYLVASNGYAQLRLRTTAWTSGTAVTSSYGSNEPSFTYTNSNINQFGGAAVALGQTTMSGSIPVVLASNQSAIPVSQSGTWNINDISGTVSLPTGAATSANQTNNLQVTQLVNSSGNAVAVKTLGSTPLAADFGLETNSLIYGLTTAGGGGYVPVKVNPSGTMETACNQSGTWTVQPGNTANTTPWLVNARLFDNAGNAINSNNNQLQVRDVINTAGQYRAQSITTSAAEALGAGTILTNRKFISLTPTNGTIYWGFSNSVTTSNGTPIFKNQTVSIAATDNVHVYVIAGATTDCRIVEGS